MTTKMNPKKAKNCSVIDRVPMDPERLVELLAPGLEAILGSHMHRRG
ncbi:hypothetical protein ABZV34_39055 [Streptomyces sp. NPDC005195]